MAITYKWDIPQMNAHIQAEGEDNVIYTVHYRYTGSEESGGETYSSTNIGAQMYTYVAGEPFVPYENTEAFEAVVIGWLEGSLNIPSMQASIAANIESQIAPVNEDLYFTWQNPIPPIPPVNDGE
jgi:hypothetical protein|tara:strand:+ start:527 stop:901 length:375 start_codon:yes stop_codon:yes gene_type:complete